MTRGKISSGIGWHTFFELCHSIPLLVTVLPIGDSFKSSLLSLTTNPHLARSHSASVCIRSLPSSVPFTGLRGSSVVQSHFTNWRFHWTAQVQHIHKWPRIATEPAPLCCTLLQIRKRACAHSTDCSLPCVSAPGPRTRTASTNLPPVQARCNALTYRGG